MAKSRGRKTGKGGAKRRPPSPLSTGAPSRAQPEPPVASVVNAIMGGDDLLGEDDPLVAEIWASQMLGTFYKLPLPIHVRDEFEKSIETHLIRAIGAAEGEKHLRVLRALAAVAPEPIGPEARAKAEVLAAQGTADPPWADEVGTARVLDAWVGEDPFGDQRLYVGRFRYPGRDPHHVTCLVDVNLGGIVKDASVGYTNRDPREALEDGVSPRDVDPDVMASEILTGIVTGDMYLDNDWTDGFKAMRALLSARMRSLVAEPLSAPHEFSALPEQERQGLIDEYLASDHATGLEAEEWILQLALDYRCDYSDGDPLRWSPIGVELFMLDFLPRKATLDTTEVRSLPRVLKSWARFALEKRGLEERWVRETEAAVDRWVTDFRREVTNAGNFGPAKAIAQAMLADGVDFDDRDAVEAWMEKFNRRPFEERDELLGDR